MCKKYSSNEFLPEEELYIGVRDDQIINNKPHYTAFFHHNNPVLSADWSRFSTPQETLKRKTRWICVASFTVYFIKLDIKNYCSCANLTIEHDPIIPQYHPDADIFNYAHCNIITNLLGNAQKRLARIFEQYCNENSDKCIYFNVT